MSYIEYLNALQKLEKIKANDYAMLKEFYDTYSDAVVENGKTIDAYEALLTKYLELIIQESQNPFIFDNYHQAIREPFDYYRFGIELFRPLIRMQDSFISHEERVDEIDAYLKQGHNVILTANHQIEPDPQVISILLENKHPKLAEDMIFVAGHRVTTDPVAIPCSKGRNLLCIYSKKHIENPPEEKTQKQHYNQRTMQKMSELLAFGGKCIYVAPSGGRDRLNAETGQIEIAPFDPQSIEMFYLMAKASNIETHFYPLSLSTYHILPPPITVVKELGERRVAKCAPVSLSFGKKIDMENIPGTEGLDKKAKRSKRAEYIWQEVKNGLK